MHGIFFCIIQFNDVNNVKKMNAKFVSWNFNFDAKTVVVTEHFEFLHLPFSVFSINIFLIPTAMLSFVNYEKQD